MGASIFYIFFDLVYDCRGNIAHTHVAYLDTFTLVKYQGKKE